MPRLTVPVSMRTFIGALVCGCAMSTYSVRVNTEHDASSGGPSVPPPCSLNLSVMQTNGCSCGPEKSGPVIGWLTTVNFADDCFGALAVSVVDPSASPVTRPVSERPDASAFSLPVASVPLTVSFTSDGATPGGRSTRTSASPPVTISGRLDSTRTCKPSAAPPETVAVSTTTLIRSEEHTSELQSHTHL